jgi:hypothetical protein
MNGWGKAANPCLSNQMPQLTVTISIGKDTYKGAHVKE